MYYGQGVLFNPSLPNQEGDSQDYDRRGDVPTVNLNLLRADRGYLYYYNTVRDPRH